MREHSDKAMTAVQAAPYGATGLAAARPQSLWRNFWRRFCRHRLALLGMPAHGIDAEHTPWPIGVSPAH